MSMNKAKKPGGKNRALPKLKIILANPYRPRSQQLEEGELKEFTQIISAEILDSGMEAKQFVTSRHIRLGLQSSLRAIKQCEMSCVFVSLTIKPRFIINQIIFFVEAKDSSVPVYVIPKLPEITEEIFGIRSLIFVLPKNVSVSVDKWTAKRRREVKKKHIPTIKNVNKLTQQIKCDNVLIKNETGIVEKPYLLEKSVKSVPKVSTTADFISFSNIAADEIYDVSDYEKEEKNLLKGLQVASENALRSKQLINVNKVEDKEVVQDENTNSAIEEDSNSYDFLDEYKALTVHKICPNPNKKSKKRKKNKMNKSL